MSSLSQRYLSACSDMYGINTSYHVAVCRSITTFMSILYDTCEWIRLWDHNEIRHQHIDTRTWNDQSCIIPSKPDYLTFTSPHVQPSISSPPTPLPHACCCQRCLIIMRSLGYVSILRARQCDYVWHRKDAELERCLVLAQMCVGMFYVCYVRAMLGRC